MDAAGVPPGAELPQERLEALRDLAEATVIADLVAGRIRGVQAMTVAGIARRHIAKAPAPQLEWATSAMAARELFHEWLIETVDDESLDSEEAIAATVEAIGDVLPKLLLRRANAETPTGAQNDDAYSTWQDNPHRRAILAWFSNRPEIPAGDILEWSKAQVRDVLDTHGSIVAWHASQQADDEAEEERRHASDAEIQARAAALRTEAEGAIHDAEARASLAAAELSRRPLND